MKIDHIILGCNCVEKSSKFFNEILNFKIITNFIDTGTGNEGIIMLNNDLKILLVPFTKERLPNPQHIAFLLEKNIFNEIYEKAKFNDLKIRAKPPLDCTEEGIGHLDFNGKKYNNFYLLDPSGINLEFLIEI